MTIAYWRHVLAPWLRILFGKVSISMPPLPTRDQVEDAWISFQPANATDYEPVVWTWILEALELIDLLVRVDAGVGWELLFDCVGIRRPYWATNATLFRPDKLLPRYTLDCIHSRSVSNNFRTVFLALRRMIGEDDQPWEPSTLDFLYVKQLLLDAWKCKHADRDFDRSREGRIQFTARFVICTDYQHQPVPFMTQHALDLARASRTLVPPTQMSYLHPDDDDATLQHEAAEQLAIRRRRAVFCFVSLDFDLLDHHPTSDALLLISTIATRALPITTLVLDHAVVVDPPDIFLPFAFYSTLIGSRFTSIKRFELARGRCDVGTISAVCSSLAQSSTVSEVVFTSSRSQVDHESNPTPSPWWRWLAYALFGVHTVHHINHVTLDLSDFTIDDLRAMQDVLRHSNPLAFVCILDGSSLSSFVLPSEPMAAILKPNTVVTSGHLPPSAFDSGTVSSICSEVPYSIIHDNAAEEFIKIVIPGVGVCCVARADVQDNRRLVRRETSPITTLKLTSVRVASRSAVLELLRLVGGTIESLVLSNGTSPMDTQFVATACEMCPRLKSLRIEGDLEDMNWVHSLVTSGSSLERLEMDGRIVDHSSLLAFIKSLGSGDRGLRKTLRTIHFNVNNERQLTNSMLHEICDHWVEMLQSNWQLEHCEFVVGEVTQDLDLSRLRVRAHNGRSIYGPEKLAFLRVVTTSHRPSALKLPHEVIETILEMAGIPSFRICA